MPIVETNRRPWESVIKAYDDAEDTIEIEICRSIRLFCFKARGRRLLGEMDQTSLSPPMNGLALGLHLA